jgi:hypothetical protein
LEDNISYIKSKKKIIKENIIEKKKERKVYKLTIEGKLKELDHKLKEYDIDTLTINNYKDQIGRINNRIKDLLTKENNIFNKNKLKI